MTNLSRFCSFVVTFLLYSAHGLETFELTILHTNDLHSRFDEVTSSGSKCPLEDQERGACYGGVARIKHLVQEMKKNNENTIFLNAGDFFQGSVWYSLLKWSVVANMTKDLGYTASSLGNHEFDDGVDDLVKYAAQVTSSYPLLACNLDLTQEPDLAPYIEASVVRKVGTKLVGIIGYVTPETKDLAQTESVIFLDEAETIQFEVDKLRNEGVDIIIALGHSGYDVDLALAEKVNGIDVIVGGHTNTFLWSGPMADARVGGVPAGKYPTVVTQKSGRKVLVVQTSGYGLYLGHLNVVFDESGEVDSWSGNPILMDKRIQEDIELVRVVDDFRTFINSQMDNSIGYSLEYLDGGRPKCRLEECSFGSFVTDAMASEMKVDIAVINSGAIKGSFKKGNITMADIYLSMPWSNTIDVVGVKGKTIREMLEHSVSDYDANNDDPRGWFLQISGLIVRYDLRRPVGERVLSLRKGQPHERESWVSLADDEIYEVALPSFLVGGGDRYTMIPEQKKSHKNIGLLDKDLLISYLKKNNPLPLPSPGRILIITESNGNTKSLPSSSRASTSFSSNVSAFLSFISYVFFLFN